MVDRMTRSGETDKSWSVTFEAAVVTKVVFNGRVDLQLESERGTIDVTLVNAVVLESESYSHEINIGAISKEQGEALMALTGQRVTRVRVSQEGQMEMAFLSGATLSVKAAYDFEAWEINGGGYVLIGLPGGGASVSEL
jgi:hypothetical protein